MEKSHTETVQVKQPYMLIEALPELLDAIQPDSIVSRTFCRGEQVRAIVFGFDVGQELSEHTSSHSAILQIVQGEATVTLGDESYEVSSGTWIYMPPRLKHSVRAKTQVIMLLEMVDCPK